MGLLLPVRTRISLANSRIVISLGLPRLAAQRLADEVGKDTTIVEPHPGAVRVENTNDPRIDMVRAMVRHDDGFGKALGLVIAAANPDRVDVAPVVFALRMDGRVAVDLA